MCCIPVSNVICCPFGNVRLWDKTPIRIKYIHISIFIYNNHFKVDFDDRFVEKLALL